MSDPIVQAPPSASRLAAFGEGLGRAALIMLVHPLAFLLTRWNLAVSPGVPWSALVLTVVLWLLWRFLDGRLGPAASAGERRALLKARGLPARVWVWSLLAGGLAMVSMFVIDTHSCSIVPAGPPGVGSLAQYPLWIGLTFLIVSSSALPALVEEAAFRGIMQSTLERAFGRFATTLIVAVAFAAFHLYGRSVHDWLAGVPAWILVSVVFSALVWLTGSIWPAVVCHFAVDLVLFSLDWLQAPFDAFRASAAAVVPRIGCVVCVVAGVLSVLAFRRLYTAAR